MKTFYCVQTGNVQRPSRRAGFSLIEVLVVIGLLSIVMMIFNLIVSNMSHETKYLRESLATADVQESLKIALAGGAVCNYVLNNPTPLTFDSTLVATSSKPVISLPPDRPLYAFIDETGPTPVPGPVLLEIGKSGSPYADSLKVSAIELVIQSGSGSNFMGHWQVVFDPTNLVRPLKPVAVNAFLTVDSSVPTAARIINCLGSGGGAGELIFGGMYSWHRSYGSCSSPNPKTLNCTCPSGYGRVLLISNGHDDGSKKDDQDLYYCVKL